LPRSMGSILRAGSVDPCIRFHFRRRHSCDCVLCLQFHHCILTIALGDDGVTLKNRPVLHPPIRMMTSWLPYLA